MTCVSNKLEKMKNKLSMSYLIVVTLLLSAGILVAHKEEKVNYTFRDLGHVNSSRIDVYPVLSEEGQNALNELLKPEYREPASLLIKQYLRYIYERKITKEGAEKAYQRYRIRGLYVSHGE